MVMHFCLLGCNEISPLVLLRVPLGQVSLESGGANMVLHIPDPLLNSTSYTLNAEPYARFAYTATVLVNPQPSTLNPKP